MSARIRKQSDLAVECDQEFPFQAMGQKTVAESCPPPKAPAQAIAADWATLRLNPLAPGPWRSLANIYAAASLEPQHSDTKTQWQRVNVGGETPAEAFGSVASHPGPSPANADYWLQNPHIPEARLWAEGLEIWLATCPGDWLSWLYSARLADGKAAFDSSHTPSLISSTDPIQRAESLEPISGETRHWLGFWRLQGGDAAGAVSALAPLADHHPQRHGSLLQLGLALLRLGNQAAAEAAFSRASASTNPQFLRLLAQRVYENHYRKEAIAVLERARSLAPGDIATLEALARLHSEVERLIAAELASRRMPDPTNGKLSSIDRDKLGEPESSLTNDQHNTEEQGVVLQESVAKPPPPNFRIEDLQRFIDAKHVDANQSLTPLLEIQEPPVIAEVDREHAGAAPPPQVGLSEHLYQLGFSNAKLSGRGSDLDLASFMAHELGSMVRFNSVVDKGTSANSQLVPTSSLRSNLLVEIAGHPYAFPLALLDEFAPIEIADIQVMDAREGFLIDGLSVGLIAARQLMQVPETSETDPRLDDCWNRIGVFGDRSCSELPSCEHCRNCPVYSAAGRSLLERLPPGDYLQEWTTVLAEDKRGSESSTPSIFDSAVRNDQSLALMIFRLAGELFALPVGVFLEVSTPFAVHSVPGRSNELFLGLVNVRGEIALAASLANLLGVSVAKGAGPQSVGRMAVAETAEGNWVFPIDEIYGIYLLNRDDVNSAPEAINTTNSSYVNGIFQWHNRLVAMLDPDPIFSMLTTKVAPH